MFLKRLTNRLWKHEAHQRALADWIHNNLREIIDQDREDRDLVNIRNPVDEEQTTFIEMHFLTRGVIRDNQELGKVFRKQWKQWIKDYNVAVSVPVPGRDKASLLFLASYDQPWDELSQADVRSGILEGVAVDFFEELQRLAVGRRR